LGKGIDKGGGSDFEQRRGRRGGAHLGRTSLKEAGRFYAAMKIPHETKMGSNGGMGYFLEYESCR